MVADPPATPYCLDAAPNGRSAVEPLGRRLFKDVSAEFLNHYLLYTDDRQTMPLQVRVLDRFFGELAIATIGRKEIEDFFAARLRAGISRPTCNRNRAALSVLFTWAIERGHVETNPIRSVRKFPERPKEARYLTPEEASRLILAARAHLRAFLVCLLYTGGRMTETLRLRWGFINFEVGAVTFERQTTKSKKTRTVPMPPILRAALLALKPGAPDAFVFTYQGRPVRSMRRALRAAVRRAGLPKMGFHLLRSTYASWFAMNDGPLTVLQDLLGHSTPMLTRRYIRLSPSYLQSAARFIGPPGSAKKADEEGS